MLSKNKQKKEERRDLNIQKKIEKADLKRKELKKELKGERKYHMIFFLTILILIVIGGLMTYNGYWLGNLDGYNNGYQDGKKDSAGVLVPDIKQSSEKDSGGRVASSTKNDEVYISNTDTPAVVTAYCLNGKTSSGVIVHEGTLACPKYIPFGTNITFEYENGNKVTGFICEDRMAKRFRNKNRFDIWMNDCQKAINFGAKEMDYIIE